MPNTTDQHSWYYPADGERDYEDTFETFFEQLDNDVEIRDTDSNKSNYDPKAGAKYIGTDTQKVYLGDGSSWNHLVTTGKNPTFDSVSTEQLALAHSGGTGWGPEDSADALGSRQSINDDSVATFANEPINEFTCQLVVRSGTTIEVIALIGGRAASGPAVDVAVQGGNSTLDTTTSDVTGTTGTDGNVTMSVRDGAIEFENRLGSSAAFFPVIWGNI